MIIPYTVVGTVLFGLGLMVRYSPLPEINTEQADIPLLDAIKMITNTPARILEVSDKKGALVTGKDADIVIFDSDINIQMKIINGRVIYKRNDKVD